MRFKGCLRDDFGFLLQKVGHLVSNHLGGHVKGRGEE